MKRVESRLWEIKLRMRCGAVQCRVPDEPMRLPRAKFCLAESSPELLHLLFVCFPPQDLLFNRQQESMASLVASLMVEYFIYPPVEPPSVAPERYLIPHVIDLD